VSTATSQHRAAAAVSGVVEGVFDTVAPVHAAALDVLTGGPPGQDGALEATVRRLLHEPEQIAVGMGLVVAPRPERGLPLRLHWWQVDQGEELRALTPDLRPESVGFYDYATSEWFAVPERTGNRHVVGPYVDVHGTGRYILTFTEPITVDGTFLGVAGADVSVTRFEAHLLAVLGMPEHPVLLLSDEGRVVLSTSAEWVVGSRLPAGAEPGEGVVVPSTPWRLVVVGPVRRGG
jgi:hypothetical protein